MVEKTYPLASFKNIDVWNTFNVYLIQDTLSYIKFVADQSIIDELNYELNDTVLSIRNTLKNKWQHPKINRPAVYISCNKPNLITLHETCSLSTINPIISHELGLIMKSKLNMATLELNCNTFYYWNATPCGGKITLFGKTNNLKIWNQAIMTVDAKKLTTSYALVENGAKTDCLINVTDKLEYGVYGKGNIYLYGQPTEIIKINTTSTGVLIQSQ